MKKEHLVSSFLKKENVFAVVGVSRNPEKYGHRVWASLRKAGYQAYAVNPNSSTIDEEKCYASLSGLPEKPDVVDLVVPPKVSERIVKECKKLGIKKVWMQPGSESEEAIGFCKKNGIEVLSKVCVMMESNKKNGV